ncbi:hypothetical protein BOTBODRAFT_54938 [Botryobasidium botryosum FD-172 SS1]|uniref:Uncharacterized protein n=1 Tax=Botryobasidium botryosum (strain FD-172 SS1) TaxID=930990 RepID=A0A067MU03_BOTB1|nr:hypothetical protein BOTBODRAFT_54938 [Botryobasidium botryosum FD-172 SS1]
MGCSSRLAQALECEHTPPTINDILLEIDPFLETLRRRHLRETVRHLVLADNGQGVSAFRAGLSVAWQRRKAPGWRRFGDERFGVRAMYTGVHWDPSLLPPNIFGHRSASALVRLVDILLSAGVDVDTRFESGDTVLISVVELAHDLKHDVRDWEIIEDPHFRAMKLSYTTLVIEVFINAGADVTMRGRAGKTALALAMGYYSVWMVQLLFELGADPNDDGGSGWTPLYKMKNSIVARSIDLLPRMTPQ